MKLPQIETGSFWLPKQSSTIASHVDGAWDAAMWVAVFFFLLIVGLTAYFSFRYTRKKNPTPSTVAHNTKMEIGWTLIPLIIVIALFFVGLAPFVNAAVAPAEAMEIQVTGEKWLWTFTYSNGTVSPNKLIVPKGKPVKLIMSSKDVLHSFFIPEFRIKKDVIPGNYTTIWFEATEAKETVLECTEYCGTGHSEMLATVQIMEEPAFRQWFDNGGDDGKLPPAELGKQAFTQWGCATCHSLDGSRLVGPSMKGLFGKTEDLEGGQSVKVDEAYLRESIVTSNAKVVKGFAPVMPVFQGVIKDKQIDGLVAFIKSQQ